MHIRVVGCLCVFVDDIVLFCLLEVSQLGAMVDEVLNEVLDVRRAFAVGFLQGNVFLAVLQGSIAHWSAKDDSLDVLLRFGDAVKDLERRWVANAGTAELIQAIDKDQQLAVIESVLKTLPESSLDLTGRAAGLRVLNGFTDVGQQMLAADPAIKQLQK